MKIGRFLSFLLVAAVVLSSCKKDPEPQPTEEEKQTALLEGTWTVGSNTVTLDGDDRTSDWSGFTLTISGAGNFNTTGSFDENVWPAGGTWAFQGTSGAGLQTIIRGDGIPMSITSLNETSLTLSFDYTITTINPQGRVESIEGTWVFAMSKQ